MDKQSFFAALARKSKTIKVNGQDVEVRAIDLDGRFGFQGTSEQGLGERFAFIAIHSCPSLFGCSIAEVVENLDPEALSEIALAAMALSGMGADQEAQAEKNSESGPN
jgi:hypothetical protein